MHLVERTKNLMISAGSEWVLWILFALSIVSIAMIVERTLAIRGLQRDGSSLRALLVVALCEGGFAKAREVMSSVHHPGARVVLCALRRDETDTCVEEVQSAMLAESIVQRKLVQRRFGFLATLGANAPFIGLFGTVVGILQAFEGLSRASVSGATVQGLAPQAVMSSIAEALVATAVGLFVAIPAVFAFNMFQRAVELAFEDIQVLSLEVLSFLHAKRAAHSHTLQPRRASKFTVA